MEVRRYTAKEAALWDSFIANAFNSSFLLKRGYMDYHSDRFTDFSLLVFEREKLLAVLPANIDGDEWVSHGGLTYAGVIMRTPLSQRALLMLIHEVEVFLKHQGVAEMVIKTLPQIYYDKLYQNQEYALFYHGFDCYRRDAATCIVLEHRGKAPKGRKSSIKKAQREGVTVDLSEDLPAFFQLQDANIKKKYGAVTVHKIEEMRSLQSKFPENIRLYLAEYEGEHVAGALVYLNKSLMHLQYFAMNEVGERLSATDALIHHLLQVCAAQGFKIFDFGISTEQNGKYLNEGLNKYKESFGGVTTLYEFYKKRINE